MRFDPAPPCVEQLEIGHGRVRLRDVCLVSPVQGAVSVHFDSAPSLRLGEGDLLRLALAEECRVHAEQGSARLRVLRTDSRWLEQALGLARSNERGTLASHRIERAGSEPARRAGRMLEALVEAG